MFRPSEIVLEAFVDHLVASHRRVFHAAPASHGETLALVARMALARLARSNAPYHDVDHTIFVTGVGQDILRGKMARDGDVTSEQWVEFLASLLCFGIGFVRDLLPGDCGPKCVVGEDGKSTITLPRGATDGALWPYFTDRGKLFVRERFANHAVLDAQALAANIEYSRFPPPPGRNEETATWPGLLRAAHVIGTVADPNFILKLRRILLELRDAGMETTFDSPAVASLRVRYPQMFWRTLHPLIPAGTELLGYTGEGRVWLSNMHAHLLAEEHREQVASA